MKTCPRCNVTIVMDGQGEDWCACLIPSAAFPSLRASLAPTPDFIDIVFDGPPSMPSPRFVEVEDPEGHGIGVGSWLQREDGYWVLRIPYVKVKAKRHSGWTICDCGRDLVDEPTTTGGRMNSDREIVVRCPDCQTTHVLGWIETKV